MTYVGLHFLPTAVINNPTIALKGDGGLFDLQFQVVVQHGGQGV